MTEKPKFHSKMIKNGRWTVVVTTGYGPVSRVGDFATEEEAQRWISTKSIGNKAPLIGAIAGMSLTPENSSAR